MVDFNPHLLGYLYRSCGRYLKLKIKFEVRAVGPIKTPAKLEISVDAKGGTEMIRLKFGVQAVGTLDEGN